MPMTLKLRSFEGAIIESVRVAHVAEQYGGQKARLPLFITREKGPPLLGRQWLHAIQLDWSRIFKLNAIPRLENSICTGLRALLDKYKSLFKDELGIITDERAELLLKEDFTEGFLALPQSQAGDQSTSEEPVPMEAASPVPTPPSETPAPERRYPSRQRRPPHRYEVRF
ncbi:hypothetical protein MRX96_014741 [Rhipicephalus microplus]